MLGAVDAALDLVPGMDAERARLQGLGGRLRAGLAAAGIDTGASTAQIVPAMVGDEAETLRVAAALQAEGVLAVAIRPPTVPKGSSRVRFALSAAHSGEDIERLIGLASRIWPTRRAA